MGAAEHEADARSYVDTVQTVKRIARDHLGTSGAALADDALMEFVATILINRRTLIDPILNAGGDQEVSYRHDFPQTAEEGRQFFNACLANDHLEGTWGTPLVKAGYSPLYAVLIEALIQAQFGKGNARHNVSGAVPFTAQRMQKVSELIGSPKGMEYQVIKKITEGMEFGPDQVDRTVAELLGAINYLAGMIIFLRKHEGAK